jgi:hypothetical protein
MPLISYDASIGINEYKNANNNDKNYVNKITLSTSTTMRIAGIVAKTSRATTRASSATSNGKESANKSSDYWSVGNHHLVISSKKEDGRCASQVPRK